MDIKPIACLIAKLRFFISLAIEQETSQDPARNYGIRPLPNLETRILAANTLIGVPGQATIRTPGQETIEASLRDNRERHFHATSWPEKQACRERDQVLRQALRDELLRGGLGSAAAERIAIWDPYDQNACADWFDAAYMFGVPAGFDIVIANPPYVESRNGTLFPNAMKTAYQTQSAHDWDVEVPKGSDLLIYFFWRAGRLLADRGRAVFITQNAWLDTNYGHKFQQSFSSRARFDKIVDCERKFFPDARTQNINTIVSTFARRPSGNRLRYQLFDASMGEVLRERWIKTVSPMKWGHQIAMSDALREALRRLSGHSTTGERTEEGGSRSVARAIIKYGQGLNFPKSAANGMAGGGPVVMKRVQFANPDYETRAEVSVARTRQVPALFMPRGVGERYYCTMNLGRAFTYSHVEVYLPDECWETDLHYCLWAYMNSSLVWLYRETTGRTNLGGGMLKAEATDMKSLPVGLAFDHLFSRGARRALESHKGREPLPVGAELASEEHRYLDGVVFEALGMEDLGETVRRELLGKVAKRLRKAKGSRRNR